MNADIDTGNFDLAFGIVPLNKGIFMYFLALC